MKNLNTFTNALQILRFALNDKTMTNYGKLYDKLYDRLYDKLYTDYMTSYMIDYFSFDHTLIFLGRSPKSITCR